ncbi:hypothetical protein [Amycolatopsis methanolica]|uniref:Phage terminase n=1 Tax=Amycolatopsis methanolica 239 TaxID=1068978 RepID=A0A076N6A4_AMYME|nr:hypothetical protein [Amycolatopsis methanolica]AIJ26370.1 phage terminase [Amycolatopsis methanolica 239]AIJ26429.1 phage terminase [Amycolatopsis methanolica 239]
MPTSPPESPKGALRPRLELIPPYVYSIGAEAIELCRRAGQELDFWQQQALTHILGVRPDGKWACFEYAELVGRQNGKGGILEGRILAGFFLLGEALIIFSAHEYKTALRAFRRLKRLIRNLGEQVGDNENLVDVDGILIKISNTNGEEGFERLDTGQEIKFIARSKASGRGFTGDLNIIDETFAYTDEQHEALLPTMSARSMEVPGPQIIYTSSPPLSSYSGEILFRVRKRALEGRSGRLGYRDWGAEGDLDNLEGIDLSDRELWTATNPAYGIRISEDFVEDELESMSPRGFARERLGIWPAPPATEGGPLDYQRWSTPAPAGCVDVTSQAGEDVAFAIDVTPKRDWASIGLYSPRADGLGHVELIDRRPGTDWVVQRLVELVARWNPVAIALDVKGPAGSLLLDLKKVGITVPEDPSEPKRGQLAIPTSSEVAAACGHLVDAVTQGTLRHIDQSQLNTAVAGAKPRPLGDAYAWARKTADSDISPLVTVTLARWAFLARIDVITADEGPPNIW